jgi:hypothetical protein
MVLLILKTSNLKILVNFFKEKEINYYHLKDKTVTKLIR